MNDENSVLHHRNTFSQKKRKPILGIAIMFLFFVFDQISTALVSIRDFIKKTLLKYTI